MEKKNIKLIIIAAVICVLLAGSTLAALLFNASITNGNISGCTTSFAITYGVSDSNDEEPITGTLFPSKNAQGGLSGKVSLAMVRDTDCDASITGKGTLKLHLNGGGNSSDLFKTITTGHCEDATSFETLSDYTSSSTCSASSSRKWVSSTTGLKYAIYTNASGSGTPVKAGYIPSGDFTSGYDVTIYDNFTVDYTTRSYYVFIWLDGYITDNSYTNKSISAYISASAVQNQ